MMDRTPRILIAANVIGLIAVALCVLAWAAGLVKLDYAGGAPWSARSLTAACALAVVGVNGIFLTCRFYSNRETAITVKSPNGIFSIAVGAIEESLARTARTLPEVTDARVRVYKEKGDDRPINIVVNFEVWEESNVGEVERKVNQACMTRFEQIAGSGLSPHFSMHLSRINVKPVRKPGRKADREEEPIDLFRGPQYPTGGEL